jgi:Cytochrome c554 and c-prime
MEVSIRCAVIILVCATAIQLPAQTDAAPTEGSPDSTLVADETQSTLASAGRGGYVGDRACESCHEEKVQHYHGTAHFLTSRLPDQNSILGKFTPGSNVLKTSNADLFFRMEAKGSDFFQTAVEGMSPYTSSRTEKFGLVVGSGNKGQTYLYWKGDELFQLPVSYWTEVGWVNSPGYRDGFANFERPIIPRCLECHGTYFNALPPPPNRYNLTDFVVGITCEKCHGRGELHIRHYRSKSAGSKDSTILNPSHFSRDRQMDLCAWCHAGHGAAVQPWFSYQPGEQLDKYIDLPRPDPNAPIDVHGGQVELLSRSRCFQSSSMTCITCHDIHVSQHNLAEFSKHCLSCHTAQSCGLFPKRGQEIIHNCIDCHMPLQETNLIVFDFNGKKVRPQVRNHWIGVYADNKTDK